MFLLDSLMISGIRWALETVVKAAEAEMNDDSALRDRLLEAEMQREMGEISDAEFATIEADLLQAIREIKERRDGGSGAFAFGPAQPLETGEDSRFQIEAEVTGEFYGEIDRSDRSGRSDRSRSDAVLDVVPVSTETLNPAARTGTTRTTRTTGTTRTNRTTRTTRANRARRSPQTK